MNISVYGFMGVGKSTVGQILAEELGYSFIDMDTVIETESETSIPDIFKKKGETEFRKLETDLIFRLAGIENTVIACGGGALANPENAITMKKNSKLVLLTASIDEIVCRTSKHDNRPLLYVENASEKASQLMRKREPIYLQYADVVIDTTEKTPSRVVEEIKEYLGL